MIGLRKRRSFIPTLSCSIDPRSQVRFAQLQRRAMSVRKGEAIPPIHEVSTVASDVSILSGPSVRNPLMPQPDLLPSSCGLSQMARSDRLRGAPRRATARTCGACARYDTDERRNAALASSPQRSLPDRSGPTGCGAVQIVWWGTEYRALEVVARRPTAVFSQRP